MIDKNGTEYDKVNTKKYTNSWIKINTIINI
jgi:hypothetical protein